MEGLYFQVPVDIDSQISDAALKFLKFLLLWPKYLSQVHFEYRKTNHWAEWDFDCKLRQYFYQKGKVHQIITPHFRNVQFLLSTQPRPC